MTETDELIARIRELDRRYLLADSLLTAGNWEEYEAARDAYEALRDEGKERTLPAPEPAPVIPRDGEDIIRRLLVVCEDVLPWAECAIDAGIGEGPSRSELVESALANHTVLLRLRAIIKLAREHMGKGPA